MDFRCHGGRYHKLTPVPEQADINKHCPLWCPVRCCPSSQFWLRTRSETHTMRIPANCLLCVLLYVSCMLWPAPDLTSHFPLLSFPVWRPNFCMYIGLHACTWSDISRALLISVSAFTELEHFMVGFSDSDWASSDLEHRRFMTGYSVFLCGGPIAWRSCLQTTVAKSATEAEYYAMRNCFWWSDVYETATAWIGYRDWNRPNLRRQQSCSQPGWQSCLTQASQTYWHTVSLYLQGGVDGTVTVLKIPTRANLSICIPRLFPK